MQNRVKVKDRDYDILISTYIDNMAILTQLNDTLARHSHGVIIVTVEKFRLPTPNGELGFQRKCTEKHWRFNHFNNKEEP